MRHRAFTILGIVICLLLIPLLVVNLTLIIRSYTSPDKVPSVFGYTPLIILSGSMEPEIAAGDLAICTNVDASEVAVGDVIAFFDPASSSSSVLTHRVVEVVNNDGTLQFKTQGDANNTADANLVPASNLVGRYSSSIPGAGNIAMFFQTVPGVIVCVVVPVVLLVVYDVIRRRKYDKSNAREVEALRAELADLRAVSA
jgi:signal peptidase